MTRLNLHGDATYKGRYTVDVVNTETLQPIICKKNVNISSIYKLPKNLVFDMAVRI